MVHSQHADSEILHVMIQVRLDPALDKGFDEAKQLWLANLDRFNSDVGRLINRR